jgi:hypothetical protein
LQPFESKGLRLRLPWGLADVSPLRARVDTGGNPLTMPVLRIDRVLASWDAPRVVEAWLSGQVFEAITAGTAPAARVRVIGARRVVHGRVTGTWSDGTAVRMEYAVIDLGGEKIVARFLGPPPLIAYNASVFRASLTSIEADGLRRPQPITARPPGWVAFGEAPPSSRLALLMAPAGWVQEPLPPVPCEGLAEPVEIVAASSPPDFARSIRASVIHQPGLTAETAAAACGTAAAGTYRRAWSALGQRFVAHGRFVPTGDGGLLHLQATGPADQDAALQELLAQWVSRLSGSTGTPPSY